MKRFYPCSAAITLVMALLFSLVVLSSCRSINERQLGIELDAGSRPGERMVVIGSWLAYVDGQSVSWLTTTRSCIGELNGERFIIEDNGFFALRLPLPEGDGDGGVAVSFGLICEVTRGNEYVRARNTFLRHTFTHQPGKVYLLPPLEFHFASLNSESVRRLVPASSSDDEALVEAFMERYPRFARIDQVERIAVE